MKRNFITFGCYLTFVVAFAVANGSCGASKPTVVSDAFGSVKALDEGFRSWDAQHQADIVAKAPDALTAHNQLLAYRDKRKPVVVAILVAYGALAAAAVQPTTASVAEALQAAQALVAALKTLGVTP